MLGEFLSANVSTPFVLFMVRTPSYALLSAQLIIPQVEGHFNYL